VFQDDQLAQAPPRSKKRIKIYYFNQNTTADTGSGKFMHFSSNLGDFKVTSSLKLHQDLRRKVKIILMKAPLLVLAVVNSSP
jgi:hypothetical protein